MFYMIYDISFITPEPTRESEIPEGDIPIYDMAGVKFGHMKRIVYSILKINMRYVQVNVIYLIF